MNPLTPIKEKTLHEFLLNRAHHWALEGRSCYLEDGLTEEKKLFKNLDDETKRIASHFYKLGFRKGDIVIHMTAYQIHQTPLMIGVWRANGIIRALYIDEDDQTILDKIKESECRFLCCDADHVQKCQSVVNKAPWPVTIIICGPEKCPDGYKSFKEFEEDDGTACPKTEVGENDTALILPTSGTTGSSKGAEHTHKGFIFTIRVTSALPFTYPKCNLIASKGVHISGTFIPLVLIIGGKKGISLHKFDKQTVLDMVVKYQPGLAFAFISFLLDLAKPEYRDKAACIEQFLLGGTKITAQMETSLRTLPNVKGINIVYGMTECIPCVSTVEQGAPLGCEGKVWPGTTIQIRGLDNVGTILPPNERGQILLASDGMMKGYFKNAEATKDSFAGKFLKTGDIGYFDDNGYLYIVDRAKEVFKVGHNHVFPNELEAIIGEHPEIREVCVFPYSPVSMGDDIPRAFATLKHPEKYKKEQLLQLAQEIVKFANDKLATYKHLKGGLYIVDDLPKGKTGKVTRSLVAQMPLPTYSS